MHDGKYGDAKCPFCGDGDIAANPEDYDEFPRLGFTNRKDGIMIATLISRIKEWIDSEQPIQAFSIVNKAITALPDDESSANIDELAEAAVAAVNAHLITELNEAGIDVESVSNEPHGYYLLVNKWSKYPQSQIRTKADAARQAMQAYLWSIEHYSKLEKDSKVLLYLLSATVLMQLHVMTGRIRDALRTAEMISRQWKDGASLALSVPESALDFLVFALADVVKAVVSPKYLNEEEVPIDNNVLEITQNIASYGVGIGRPLGNVWPTTWRRLVLDRTKLLYRLGRGQEALEAAADAVESAPDDRSRVLALGEQAELRAKVLGETGNLAPVMEFLAGSGRTIEQINATVQALSEGQAIADTELSDLAKEFISTTSEIRAADGTRPTLNLDVRSAIEDGDDVRLALLRPDLERLAASDGHNAHEAGFLLSEVAHRIDDHDGVDLLERAFDRAMREVKGSEAVALTDSIARVYLCAPSLTQFAVWRKAAGWLCHVADTLQEQTEWGTWIERLEASKWLVPTLDVACHFALVVADIAGSNGTAVLATLHRLHGLLYGQSLQLALATRNSTQPGDDELQLARQVSAASVAGGSGFKELRNRLFAAGHQRRCIATAALADVVNVHDDDRINNFPQVALVEIGRFSNNSNEESGSMVDRVWKSEHGFDATGVTLPIDLETVAENVFKGVTVDLNLLEHMAPLLEPHASMSSAFGIRASGLVHAIPFSAVPLADGRFFGEISVPVILIGNNPVLSLLYRPIDLSRVLAVGDAIYDQNQLTLGLADNQVFDPVKNEVTTLEAAWASIDEWNGESYDNQEKENLSLSGLPPLPGSRVEALLVAKTAGAVNKPLLGTSVSPTSLFASLTVTKPSILHFAVHGIADTDDPARSRLLLSGDAEDALAFDEIMLLDLSNTDLVILSACVTAQGRIHVSEGVMALAWAFRASGAKAVIATRWQTNDLASVLFWQKFYETLSVGSGLADALLAAQNRLISDPCWEDPYYWACYQLYL